MAIEVAIRAGDRRSRLLNDDQAVSLNLFLLFDLQPLALYYSSGVGEVLR